MPQTAVRSKARSRNSTRSKETVRGLILEAAQSCFAESGYALTTTRQIAARADVVECLIFNHFGSKSALFEAAVVDPFRRGVDQFLSDWKLRARTEHAPEATVREYVGRLYDLLDGHSDLLIALMRDRRENNYLLPLFEQLERVGSYEAGAQGWSELDIQVLVRCHFGMVAFNAAFGGSLYGTASRAPSRERIIDEMTASIMYGSAGRVATR